MNQESFSSMTYEKKKNQGRDEKERDAKKHSALGVQRSGLAKCVLRFVIAGGVNRGRWFNEGARVVSRFSFQPSPP